MDISTLDRQGLLDYIETLETKTAALEEQMEDMKAQVDLLDMDFEEFRIPEGLEPQLHVSNQTADALASAAALFGEVEEIEDIEVEPASVKNGVVTLNPVAEEEAYIPVASTSKKKPVKVTIKLKKS